MADENAVNAAEPANTTGEDEKGGEGGGAPKQPSSDDTYEPEVRKPWSNREERAEFFKAKKVEKESEQGGESYEDDPDFVKKADAYFEKRISPQFKQMSDSAQEQKDDFELRSYLSENPTMKKYEARAKKDMKAYPTVPVSRIFKSLAYDDALAEGATRGDKAKVKAKQSSVSGSGERKSPQAPDFLKMTSKEFNDYKRSQKASGKFMPDEEAE